MYTQYLSYGLTGYHWGTYHVRINFKNLSALTARYFLRLSPCLDFHSGLYDFSCTFNITWKQRETKVHVIKVFIWLPISQKYYHFYANIQTHETVFYKR